MEQTLPYVAAAFFCERVIEGKDGVLSAIRIVDKIQVGLESDIPSLKEQLKAVKPAAQITALISVKAGSLKGMFSLSIVGERPSGKRAKLSTFQMELNGGDSGQNFVANIMLSVEEEGLHWFDVLFEDRLLTKMPITLLLVHTQGEQSS